MTSDRKNRPDLARQWTRRQARHIDRRTHLLNWVGRLHRKDYADKKINEQTITIDPYRKKNGLSEKITAGKRVFS